MRSKAHTLFPCQEKARSYSHSLFHKISGTVMKSLYSILKKNVIKERFEYTKISPLKNTYSCIHIIKNEVTRQT